MENSIENNKILWDEKYRWEKNGDEWTGQAIKCKMPYEDWKQSMYQNLIVPYIHKKSIVLEIGAGHGRWSSLLAPTAGTLFLVDLSSNCIDFCRRLFASQSNIKYLVNDGKTLSGIEDSSIDFVWSYDTFVHIDEYNIDSYLSEIYRVLHSGGRAIVHHPGRNHYFLFLGFIRHLGKLGNWFYRLISMHQLKDIDGWRSNVSSQMFKNLAEKNGLEVIEQLQYWDKKNKIGVPRFNDCISILGKK